MREGEREREGQKEVGKRGREGERGIEKDRRKRLNLVEMQLHVFGLLSNYGHTASYLYQH